MTQNVTHTQWYQLVALALCLALVATSATPVLAAPRPSVAAAAPASRQHPASSIQHPVTRNLQPATHDTSLSLSRLQSTYTPSGALSGTLVVTFTVTNDLSPASGLAATVPDLAADTTLTATVAALEAQAATVDANTVRQVLLVDTLTAGTEFVAATPVPDRNGRDLAWNLGDVPPLGTLTVTLVLSAPTSVAAITALDTGAQAWGTVFRDPVSARACPVTLAPDTVGATNLVSYLQATVDADYTRPEVAQHAGALCTVADAFTAARTLGYEAYTGSLRGARGTLWSAAGNSLDQANLLVATLRANGIPARYRHGTLDDARARELVLSMFPTTGAVVGYVPAGAAVSDPGHDPDLLADARDHWWVEAYQDGAWVALDPSFSYATPGETFATPVGDPVAEVPAALRHTVTVTLEIERYSMLSYLTAGFVYTQPLTTTFTTAELVGEPLTLKHLVNAQTPPAGCLVFCWTHYTYAPYLRIGDRTEVLMGHQYWELLSDFPLGQFAVTAAWLHLDVRDAAGQVTRYTRELADRVGIARRAADNKIRGLIPDLLTTQAMDELGPDTPSLVHAADNHTVYFSPSLLSPEHAAQAGENLLAAAPRVLAAQPVVTGLGDIETVLNGGTLDVSGKLELAAVADTVEDTTQAFNRLFAASFVALSDRASADLAATGLVKAYPDSPRITIASMVLSRTRDSALATPVQALDLLHDQVRVVAYPGQALAAEPTYRMTRGINETFLEQAVGTALISGAGADDAVRVHSAAGVLQAAAAQEITLRYVDAERLDVLAGLDLPEAARARLLQAAQQGYGLLVPEQAVLWQGAPTVAWWQVDLASGEVFGVGETGLHQFIVTLPAQLELLMIIADGVNLLLSYLRYLSWQVAAEVTWARFARYGALAADQGTDLQTSYLTALAATKEYMNTTGWDTFQQLWEDSWLSFVPAENLR